MDKKVQIILIIVQMKLVMLAASEEKQPRRLEQRLSNLNLKNDISKKVFSSLLKMSNTTGMTILVMEFSREG